MTVDVDMQSMQRRVVAINPGFQVPEIVARGHQKPYTGAPINISAVVQVYLILGIISQRSQDQEHQNLFPVLQYRCLP